jgi:hypothetical protein
VDTNTLEALGSIRRMAKKKKRQKYLEDSSKVVM